MCPTRPTEKEFLVEELRDTSGFGYFRSAEFNRMQDQLISGEACIRTVMDSVADAVITLDDQGTIESVNKATRTVFDYPPEDLRGCHIKTLLPTLVSDDGARFDESKPSTFRGDGTRDHWPAQGRQGYSR